MKELYSFSGYRDGKKVLDIIDVECVGSDAESYCIELIKMFDLIDCDYHLQ
jgi:hypothetical protein